EKLFGCESGGGYPKEKQQVERQNKKILESVRTNNFKDLISCLKGIDAELLKGALGGAQFKELFFANCKDTELAAYVKSIVC
ncbi:MAG: hypothetical protein RSA00_08370, partial [Hydrogenoanaerobacterium sp.]